MRSIKSVQYTICNYIFLRDTFCFCSLVKTKMSMTQNWLWSAACCEVLYRHARLQLLADTQWYKTFIISTQRFANCFKIRPIVFVLCHEFHLGIGASASFYGDLCIYIQITFKRLIYWVMKNSILWCAYIMIYQKSTLSYQCRTHVKWVEPSP